MDSPMEKWEEAYRAWWGEPDDEAELQVFVEYKGPFRRGYEAATAAERAKWQSVIEAARDASEYWRIEGGDVVGFEQLMKRLDATLRAATVEASR